MKTDNLDFMFLKGDVCIFCKCMIQICRTRDVLMIESRNINIIVDAGGNRLVLINDILFKGKSRRNQKRKT